MSGIKDRDLVLWIKSEKRGINKFLLGVIWTVDDSGWIDYYVHWDFIESEIKEKSIFDELITFIVLNFWKEYSMASQ